MGVTGDSKMKYSYMDENATKTVEIQPNLFQHPPRRNVKDVEMEGSEMVLDIGI